MRIIMEEIRNGGLDHGGIMGREEGSDLTERTSQSRFASLQVAGHCFAGLVSDSSSVFSCDALEVR